MWRKAGRLKIDARHEENRRGRLREAALLALIARQTNEWTPSQWVNGKANVFKEREEKE